MFGLGPTELAPLVCLATAVIAGLLARRFLSRERCSRFAPVIVAIGFCTGWLMLFSWRDIVPSRHYHWTFPIAVVAAIAGAIVGGLSGWKRILLDLPIALAAAYLLVPTWKSLAPMRPAWIAIVAAYFGILASLIAPLSQRISPVAVAVSFLASASVLSALVTAIYSLTYGVLAGLSASALIGWALATRSWINGDAVRRLALFYATIVGGAAFIACIEPEPPALKLLAISAAPLSLWLFARGPWARLQGWKAVIVPLGVVALSLTALGGWIVVQSGGLSDLSPE